MRRNMKYLHIWHVCDVENVSTCTIYAVLLYNWFCSDLCTFVAKSVLMIVNIIVNKLSKLFKGKIRHVRFTNIFVNIFTNIFATIFIIVFICQLYL